MKKYTWLFLSIFTLPVFAETVSDFTNMCGVSGRKIFYAVPKDFTCESGYFLPANATTCYTCPDGYTCSGGSFPFSATRAQGLVRGNTYVSAAKVCAANTVVHNMYAVPRSFTCNQGDFLPANSFTCYACPDGYTCSGGTFVFSTTRAQGIIRNENMHFDANVNKTCARNMEHVLNGSFEPNTITINWNDGTNTSTSQCVFGTPLILPPEPVRPGYVFGGWKIKKN